jgi:hypothetical protein
LPEALGAELPVRLGGEAVVAGTEVVADGAEGFQEPLGMFGRLEALQRPLSFPHRPV